MAHHLSDSDDPRRPHDSRRFPARRDRTGPPADAPRDALTRELLSEPGLERTHELVLDAVCVALPAVSAAGLTLLCRDGSLTSGAASNPLAATLGAHQDRCGEGPGYDCVRRQDRVVVGDLAAVGAQYWPRFTPVALEHRVGAVCSVHLPKRHGTAGALTLYAADPRVLDPAALATASLLGSYAAVAIGGARRAADLTEALASRDVIGQAKGMLMARRGIDDQQAFAALVEASQYSNIKVRDVAVWLVHEPTGPPTGPSTSPST